MHDRANYLRSEIAHAVLAGDTKKIHALYRKGGDAVKYGPQALRDAAYFGQLPSIIALLEEGESPNQLINGRTPLQAAIKGFRQEISFGQALHGKDDAHERNETLMSVAKILLAAGMHLPAGETILSELLSFSPVPTLLVYLEDLNTGTAIPTARTLAAENIHMDLEKCASRSQMRDLEAARRARDENGIVLNNDALRAKDMAPRTKLNSPIEKDGRIIRPNLGRDLD